MGDKLLQWGMIGCGNVTERKSAPAFNKIQGSRLVAVGSRTPEKARDYASRHGIPKWHRDPFEVIRDPQVDIIYIATPPGSHMEYALEVIREGKLVYIEKPMARTWEECRQINDAASKKGLPVFVAYYRRALDYFLKVKELIDSGQLGKLLFVNIQQHFPAREKDGNREDPPWHVVPSISGGGYFHDVGCHALDILFYFFGDPLEVQGYTANRGGLYEPEDTLGVILRMPGNLLVSGSWNFITPESYRKDLVEVVGEKAKVKFSIFSFAPITLIRETGREQFELAQPEHIQMPLIKTIVSELRGKGHCPSTGDSAAVTSWVMDQVLGSISYTS
jgi:1,5-anhydro-D-fructose reductase (1,5-anhydro-D-mannitol-forming)